MAEPAPYQVLARKYRPHDFSALIGQGPMVRTLKNAFATGRIPQAWMLTGVRGVGKTTTARILARALNYERDGARTPTVDLETPGDHCQAIIEGRHVDVIEMDAASHTGIGDIREITDAARYKPAIAPFKVYIIDEVHMLSTAAFNGLLKTLEEPPAHVKFIFATTEIRKVPVTVLSRCQRFDLRRVDEETLAAHFASIAQKEGISVSAEALGVLARVADGSVRDGLSLFDQAIAHGGGAVEAGDLRQMLGLADRGQVVTLFDDVMKGDAPAALATMAALYEVGAEPQVVLADLAALTHEVTKQKVLGTGEGAAAERGAGLSMAVLSRTWQALLQGIGEVQTAPKPLVAAEMVLIRLCYMATLPDPALGAPTGGTAPAAEPPRAAAPKTPSAPRSLADIVSLLSDNVRLRGQVERCMRLVSLEPGRLEVTLTPDAAPTVAGALGKALTEKLGARWVVSVSDASSAPTLKEAHVAEQARLRDEVAKDPLVRAVLDTFDDAEIGEVTVRAPREDETPEPRRRERN
ncbi:MAG: DNA polymerase III subunit gamma/tau [Pseudomonadota bacterium]